MKTVALLCAALMLMLLLLLPGVPATASFQTPFTVLVMNNVTKSPNKTYSTSVPYRGILLGGLRRLNDSDKDFTFTYTDNRYYGPILESVNGVAANIRNSTYWQLLIMTTSGWTRPDGGLGCYIPKANEIVILKYIQYITPKSESDSAV